MARGKSSNDSTIRMMNLLALLTDATAPKTIDQIAQAMSYLDPQYRYPEGKEARRTAFNRDKAALIKLGVPIVTSTLAGQDAGVGAYIIDKSEYRLIDFGLTAEEMDALQRAAAVVQIEQSWGRQAVQWLGGAVEAPPTSAVAHVAAQSPHLTSLWAGVTRRCEVVFGYHGRSRTVQPWGMVARNGFWYLVGRDTAGSEQRTYRVDRIEGTITVGKPDSFERPGSFDISTAVPNDPKSYGNGDREHAIVRVDANLASGVVAELGESAVVATDDNGAVDVSVPCGNFDAFCIWLFAMVDRAEVLSPPHVRQRVIDVLNELAGAR